MTSNPFHRSLDERFRGRKVRATSNDGVVFTGWVERVHHHDRHVVVLDATNHNRGEKVGAVLVSHADTIETLPEDGHIERVNLEDVHPSPYHCREFEESANRGYVADVRDSGFVGSYPVVRETPEGFEVVEGHKRLWACRQAGINTHPARIVDIDDWTATRRFAVDHLPDPGQVNQNGTASGCYEGDQLHEVIDAIVDDWEERARDLDRVQYNAQRLDVDVPWRDTSEETVSSSGNRELDFEDLEPAVEPAPEEDGRDDVDWDELESATEAVDDTDTSKSTEFEQLATTEVKSYGIVFGQDVAEFFADADRVTVRDHQGRYELAPGASEEWPDYAVSEAKIQLGNPAVEVLDAVPGAELTLHAADDVAIITVDGAEPTALDAARPETETTDDQADDVNDGDDPLEERLVDVLDEHGELPSTDIELLLETSSAHYRNVLQQLQREGRVETRQDPEDRRRNLYQLVDDSEDEPDADDGQRTCGCGFEPDGSLEYSIHRLEDHNSPQPGYLGDIEPGEFEAVVQNAASVQDIVDDTPWSQERVLRALHIYGLDDVVGPADTELSDLTDFEFDGLHDPPTEDTDDVVDHEDDDPPEDAGAEAGGSGADGPVQFTDFGADPGNGTECQNCGAHLDKKFGKVFEPESEGAPRCCPNCTDLVRDGNEIREARAPAGRGTQS